MANGDNEANEIIVRRLCRTIRAIECDQREQCKGCPTKEGVLDLIDMVKVMVRYGRLHWLPFGTTALIVILEILKVYGGK